MKYIKSMAAVWIVLLMTGCTAPGPEGGSDQSGYPITYLHPDWPSYATAEEIEKASTYIYSGTVTDVSFEIIDYSTGKIDRDRSSTASSRTLYTIYTIRTDKNFKGESPSEVKICVIGGIVGFREEEQFKLLESSGLIQPGREGIHVSVDDCRLATGKEYLFCTSGRVDGLDFIINPDQFAHNMESEDAKEVIRAIKPVQ